MKLSHLAVASLVALGAGAAVQSPPDAPRVRPALNERDALEIVKKAFDPLCGPPGQSRCSYASGNAEHVCPFEVAVAFGVDQGPDGGGAQEAPNGQDEEDGDDEEDDDGSDDANDQAQANVLWVALNGRGGIIGLGRTRQNACPLMPVPGLERI